MSKTHLLLTLRTRQRVAIRSLDVFTAQEIRTVRSHLQLTQVQFSELLGVSVKTVQAWETGINTPNGCAKRLLFLLKNNPSSVLSSLVHE